MYLPFQQDVWQAAAAPQGEGQLGDGPGSPSGPADSPDGHGDTTSLGD